MDIEQVRVFLRSLPHVVETASEATRWGDKLVYRVGDQSVGGRMFSQIDFKGDGRAILSFAVDPEAFPELSSRGGIIPAPYRARLHWIALQRGDALRDGELKTLLRGSNARTFVKLPKSTRYRLLKGGA